MDGIVAMPMKMVGPVVTSILLEQILEDQPRLDGQRATAEIFLTLSDDARRPGHHHRRPPEGSS
jgi:hypothetical protein